MDSSKTMTSVELAEYKNYICEIIKRLHSEN